MYGKLARFVYNNIEVDEIVDSVPSTRYPNDILIYLSVRIYQCAVVLMMRCVYALRHYLVQTQIRTAGMSSMFVCIPPFHNILVHLSTVERR